MSRYKFQQYTKDEPLNNTLREIEDNFATYETAQQKIKKIETIKDRELTGKDLENGDIAAYDDGTNKYIVFKINGTIIKLQET